MNEELEVLAELQETLLRLARWQAAHLRSLASVWDGIGREIEANRLRAKADEMDAEEEATE